MYHEPVMKEEVLSYLLHEGSRLILDATIGSGAHAKAILDSNKYVSLVGVDRDEKAIHIASQRLKNYGERVSLFNGLYTELETILLSRGNVDGVLVDHGISSMQLEDPHRGFSYREEGTLDMRMGGEGPTAKDTIETSSEAELAAILERFGELTRPRRIARAIKDASKKGRMQTTADLRNAVERVFGRRLSPRFMGRLFQSFRLFINRELELLGEFLDKILNHVNRDARLVFISYHSLEDRQIKEFFKRESAACTCPPEAPLCVCGRTPTLEVLTKKVVKTSKEEIKRNPRSKSACLRAARVLV
jgi:16S rRNA (cytosine1402-N4)-methyltransferase